MIRIKVIKLKSIIRFLVIVGVIAFAIGIFVNKLEVSVIKAGEQNESQTRQEKQSLLEQYKRIDWHSIILSNQIPAFEFEPKTGTAPIKNNEQAVVEANASNSNITVQNTENEHTDEESKNKHTIDIKLNQPTVQIPQQLNISGDEQIFIYHTHTREAYKQSAGYEYNEPKAEPYRCNDFNYTVAHVGDILTESLTDRGISVVHDKTEHEQKELGTAYVRSLETINNVVAQNKGFDLVIDLHRDGFAEGTENPDEHVVVIDGQRYAKFFVLIGTGEGQAGGFKIKPDWEKNYKVAQELTTIANQEYPGIADDVLIKTGRYNQHVTNNMILIEVGSNVTTLDEAERTAELLGDIIHKWLAVKNQ